MADDVVKTALEQFAESEDGSSEERSAYHDDIDFGRLGNQWPDKVKRLRNDEGRPCLTINKLPAFVRQVVNDGRQMSPAIKVRPVDSGADPDTATVINGLVRSIERNGDGAAVAYDTALDGAVSGGFGFFRLVIDYAHDDTFDLECKIARIANPLMVHWDVSSTAFDASDWEYGFISDFLTKKQFERRYKDAEPVSFEGNDQAKHWLNDDEIRVAEYFRRDEVERTLLLLSNGNAIREEFFTDDVAAIMSAQGIQVTRSRIVRAREVKRFVISGVETLEEDVWPGSTIPICPVWGEEVFLDGHRHFRSLIRDAKDPQQMYNFWRSASTELVALAPKAPFIVAKGQIAEEDREKWDSANTRSHPYLEYEASVSQVPPQRQPFAGVPAGALQEALSASDDMKAQTSIYDPSLGARSNETSGKAIMARQRESDVSNFHFLDNLSRAIRYAGTCLVEIIPAVYSPRQTLRILGEDQKERVVKLVSESMRNDPAMKPPYRAGEERLYDLTVGKYDVTVESGASYQTQREETREALVEIMRMVPGAAAVMGDLVVKSMDFEGADELTERLQGMLQAQYNRKPDPLAAEEQKAKIAKLQADAIQALAKAKSMGSDTEIKSFEAIVSGLKEIDAAMAGPGPIPAATMPGQTAYAAQPGMLAPDGAMSQTAGGFQ